MTITTRYKAAKLTGVTEAVFSRMWARQQENEDDYEFFTDDGKIDVDHSAFTSRYDERIKPEVLDKIKNPPVKKSSVKKVVSKKKIVPPKKTVPKKTVPKKTIPKKKVIKKETKIIVSH